MQHLRPEDLIDLADGTRADSDVPHLASCDVCRRRARGTARHDRDGRGCRCRRPRRFSGTTSRRVSQAVEVERAAAAGNAWRRVWSWPRADSWIGRGRLRGHPALMMNAPARLPRFPRRPKRCGRRSRRCRPRSGSICLATRSTIRTMPHHAGCGSHGRSRVDAAADAGLTAPGSGARSHSEHG
jgi:hypothetical protein